MGGMGMVTVRKQSPSENRCEAAFLVETRGEVPGMESLGVPGTCWQTTAPQRFSEKLLHFDYDHGHASRPLETPLHSQPSTKSAPDLHSSSFKFYREKLYQASGVVYRINGSLGSRAIGLVYHELCVLS